MFRRVCLLFGALGLLMMAPFIASAQQSETPAYTFIAEWKVPQEKWNEFTAFEEKTSRPVLERFFADGTITGWVYIVSRVHHATGNSHGLWFTATSIARIERVVEELLKLPTNPTVIGTEYHHDHLLQSVFRGGRAAAGNGYLVVNAFQVLPGKGQEWRQLVKKHFKPTWDELVANGTISYYEMSVEHIHTQDAGGHQGWYINAPSADASGGHYGWYIAPSAEAMDKVSAAFEALERKRSAEENRTIAATIRQLEVPDYHRDSLYRVPSYARK